MSISIILNRSRRYLLPILFLVILVGASIVRSRAQSSLDALSSGTPESTDAGPHPCAIANIAVLDNRIHVRCTSPVVIGPNNVYYFAASGDSSHMLATNRFLTLLNTAYALGKPVYVYYDADSSANIPGCQTSDCRNISWLYIVP